MEIISEDGSEFKDVELTRMYRDFLEKNIRQQPANYLWSHRRWKHTFKQELQKKWIDNVPAPISV